MYRVIFLRHGQSFWNRKRLFTGWTDVDLTSTGIKEAKKAASILKKEGMSFDIAYFFNISCWNSMAENCASSLKKGDRVLINGHMNLRSWENKEGKKFNIINITADIIAASLEFNKIIYDKEDTDFIKVDEGSKKKKEKVKV